MGYNLGCPIGEPIALAGALAHDRRPFSRRVFAMFAFFRCLALAVLLAGALAAPTGAAEPLTPEQKDAVEAVIHDYFLKHPEFMVEVLRAAEAKIKQDKAADARQAIAAYRKDLLADATSPVGGNPNGDVTIVEFFDYRCPYCKQVEPALEALMKEDPKVRIIYKEFPVLGAESVYASRMALAAVKQDKYLEFHKAMMATKGQITEKVILQVAATAGIDIGKAKADMTAPGIKDILQHNYSLAEALDINGTPAFIIGDTLVPGATDIDGLRKLIADARKAG
jgi:protein-disulfide isomerase